MELGSEVILLPNCKVLGRDNDDVVMEESTEVEDTDERTACSGPVSGADIALEHMVLSMEETGL